MNSEEAKFILQAYRHNEADSRDPDIARALAQAQRDPELAEWLAQDARLHRLVRDGLQRIPVPAQLKAQILAGGKIVSVAPWWRQPLSLAAAAAVLICGTLATFWWVDRSPGDFAEYRRDMSDFLTTELTYLDHEAPSVETLQRYLSQHDAPASFRLPAKMNELISIGCRVVRWHGRKVSLICFHAGQGREVHMFVMEESAWKELPSADAPLLVSSGFWMTAAWQDDGKAFLLAGRGGRDSLSQMF